MDVFKEIAASLGMELDAVIAHFKAMLRQHIVNQGANKPVVVSAPTKTPGPPAPQD